MTCSLRNARAGSKLTLTLRDHHVDAPLQHGRMYLVGNVTLVEEKAEAKRVGDCYLEKHADSRVVSPGADVHTSGDNVKDFEIARSQS